MDLHRLGEERSIAYHEVIAERLLCDPSVRARAQERVGQWLASCESTPFYALKWAEVLSLPTPSLAAFLVERSELAFELRQSSPFAGVLTPRERWKIFSETRARLAKAS